MMCVLLTLTVMLTSAGARAADDVTEAHAKAVAGKAILALQHGLATGELQPFYDMLDESISFFFPNMSEYRYLKGKPPVQAFFDRVHTGYNRGLFFVEILRVAANDNTVVTEARVEAQKKDDSWYRNRVAISLDVCGEKICAYREYFGSDAKSN
jgi:hypothetical protein